MTQGVNETWNCNINIYILFDHNNFNISSQHAHLFTSSSNSSSSSLLSSISSTFLLLKSSRGIVSSSSSSDSSAAITSGSCNRRLRLSLSKYICYVWSNKRWRGLFIKNLKSMFNHFSSETQTKLPYLLNSFHNFRINIYYNFEFTLITVMTCYWKYIVVSILIIILRFFVRRDSHYW